MSSSTNGKALYENLDTAFVNLWSLLRNLTQRGFVGRVHVELRDYSADVYLNGSGTPVIHEVDRAAGTDTLEEAALHRLVLRARETPGKISVFESANDVNALQHPTSSPVPPMSFAPGTESATFGVAPQNVVPPANVGAPNKLSAQDEIVGRYRNEQSESEAETDSQRSLAISLGGELIGAVERGINASGEDFAALFNAVRLELADDYSYLDPISNALNYSNDAVSLTQDVPEAVYVTGLSEALRRTVERVAVGDRARRVRERIALELLGVARKRRDALDHCRFGPQLERIAGTKVM